MIYTVTIHNKAIRVVDDSPFTAAIQAAAEYNYFSGLSDKESITNDTIAEVTAMGESCCRVVVGIKVATTQVEGHCINQSGLANWVDNGTVIATRKKHVDARVQKEKTKLRSHLISARISHDDFDYLKSIDCNRSRAISECIKRTRSAESIISDQSDGERRSRR